ncbi:LysR family transcriptional regulator [Siculibacillus lacustris]|uniref:LysR family transcriptional regulator n=1 Tax=Siculibacillus lacustris TaxID=1549641 RepID=A0A4Q9VP26_9HYPH|nr:LysR family transcriptional regulator [Siculibacillus lacustris]TBW37346.1 LysR family transcriptional regulator [Siculibacillus lacustris]
MPDLDLNLLVALDALLRDRSVSAAARKLGLSTSAMSRTLARLRAATGDPLLVPAGRALVATPRAEAIAEEVRSLTIAVRAVLSPPPQLDIRTLKRDFTLRTNEAFVQLHAARLAAAVMAAAPGVRLRFVAKPDKEIQSLRDGTIDLDIGVVAGDGAELRAQTLFRDRFVGIVRAGHPLLTADPLTAEHFVAWGHVVASRRRQFVGGVDPALAALGLSRVVRVVVPSFPAVVAVAAESDLIGMVPRSFSPADLGGRIALFELPVATPEIVVSQIWHPRMDADFGHRWLRGLIFESFRSPPAAIRGSERSGSLERLEGTADR